MKRGGETIKRAAALMTEALTLLDDAGASEMAVHVSMALEVGGFDAPLPPERRLRSHLVKANPLRLVS